MEIYLYCTIIECVTQQINERTLAGNTKDEIHSNRIDGSTKC